MAEKIPTSKYPAFNDQRHLPRNDALSALFDMVRDLSDRFIEISTKFEMHMSTEEGQRDEILEKLEDLSIKIDSAVKLKDAFVHVDGEPDVHGHRTDHLTRIKFAESSDKFWGKVKEEAVSKVVSAILIAAVVIFALGLKDWVEGYMKDPVKAIHQIAPKGE